MTSVPRLLAVHAHPDDEASKGAATLAKYVARGYDVMVATCTDGNAGSILNEAMDRPEIRARLPEVRRAELAASVAILGVGHQWLGFADSGWPDGEPPARGTFAALPLEQACLPLVRLVRQFRPHVIISYDENGGYPHPDHIRCHEISVAAFDAAPDATRCRGTGEPWQPLKLYYVHEWCGARMRAFHDALLSAGLPSPYHQWLREFTEDRDVLRRITTRVPCAEFFERRDAALAAHATQIAPRSHWFAVPLSVQRDLWPTEDFELARSLVPARVPEEDLLAGVGR